MKKIDVGQTVTILANLGVIAGIIFLAIELRQNNELLAAEARANQLEARIQTTEQLVANPDVARILFKLTNGQEATPEELYQFRWFARGLFVRWEWQFEEYQQGFIDLQALPLMSWASWFRELPDFRGEWEAAASPTPEFREFVDSRVIPLVIE